MLVHAILFDSAMPVSAVLSRLARYGIWLDPKQPDAAERIAQEAELRELPFDEVATLLAEPNHSHYGAAIRRQWVVNVLWYARSIRDVLDACSRANRDTTLLEAMGLHETDSRPTYAWNAAGRYATDGVVVQNDRPVAVNLKLANAAPAFQQVSHRMPAPNVGGPMRSAAAQAEPEAPRPTTVSVWPRMEAPNYVSARVPFDLTVGFSLDRQQGVAGGQVNLIAAAGAEKIDVSVELLAEGFDAPDGGWTRPLSVPVANPASVSVTFRLVAQPPTGTEPVRLTTLEVRFVIGGKVCGTASRPVIIGPETGDRPRMPEDRGTPFMGELPTATPMDMSPDPDVADLTIDLVKLDKNPAVGDFKCHLISRHALQTPMGPWDVHLGQDVKTFAQDLIKRVRQSSSVLVTKYLRSVGKLVTQVLPPEVFDAIAEVAAKTAPKPPAVLFVTDEPFVPWELAFLESPVDKSRPPFLGAQTIFGRWFRDPNAATSPQRRAQVQKPPSNPPAGIAVKHMAAIAGNYTPKSGLAALPGAEAEVKKLKASMNAVPMRATPEAVLQVLEARLERETDLLGPAGAVHYAGHGQFDAADPDSSVLFLSDGTVLSSLLFRDAEYGGEHQPIIFFNACMIGVGGEVLGDMGGFPGNCLRGGFGAVLGALWEVDDTVAGDIALEFWERVLPASGQGEPVAEVLRDLRGKYSPQQPVPTYLAYTYWGHPRLRLQRVN